MNRLTSIAKTLFFLFGIGFLGYRIVIIGVATHFAEQDGESAAAAALKWHPGVPQALIREAQKYRETDLDKAEYLLQQAALENPADGLVYAMLAGVRKAQGKIDIAERLMSVAAQLAPMESRVQILALDFWLQRENLERILYHLSSVLLLRADLRSQLFPVLLRLVTELNTRPLVLSVLEQPHDWWPGFFAYAAANGDSLEIVRLLYYMRAPSDGASAPMVRAAYLTRLEKEEKWDEMYFIWLNGLSESELDELANIYNGSFELPLSQAGFDWRTPRKAGISVDVLPTDGSVGQKALRVSFHGRRIRSSPVFQHLFLSPERYQIRGQVRLRELEGEHGVQWRLKCLGASSRILAATAAFVGSSPWRRFTLDFEVPTDKCEAQVLELVVVGRVALDFEVKGEVWFDALTIIKMTTDQSKFTDETSGI